MALSAVVAPSASADDPSSEEVRRLREDLEAERRARAADRAEFDRRLAAVESRTYRPTREEIAADVDAHLAEKDAHEGAHVELARPAAASHFAVSAVLDVTFGTSTATDGALPSVNLGHHDPRVRGANVRNEELVLSGGVDPWFWGYAAIVYTLDEEGESLFEVEEAYAVTTAMHRGLQLKVGQFFTEFGRTNPVHPHAWEFLEYPVILARAFGPDGWRGQGARLAWTPPCTRCPVTLLAGFQNARGETQAAFLGEEGEEVGDHVLQDRDVANLSDLAYHVRAEVSCDRVGACSTRTWLAGVSAGFGPNATGDDGRTEVYGADVTLAWRPNGAPEDWPFVAWQTEALWRRYHADDQVRLVDDGMGGFVPVDVGARTYDDWGAYSQVVWGFRRPWTIGLRIDFADTDRHFEGTHHRESIALTYYWSEASRVRLQLQHDRVRTLDDLFPGEDEDVFSVWLNFDFSLGAHAHDF